MDPFPITQINNNGTVNIQQGIMNDAANNISTSQIFTFMISRTLIIGVSEV